MDEWMKDKVDLYLYFYSFPEEKKLTLSCFMDFEYKRTAEDGGVSYFKTCRSVMVYPYGTIRPRRHDYEPSLPEVGAWERRPERCHPGNVGNQGEVMDPKTTITLGLVFWEWKEENRFYVFIVEKAVIANTLIDLRYSLT